MAKAAPRLSAIVAVSENMGIGKNGDLPWNLKEEFKYFTRMTKATEDPSKKNAVLMGRKTWESIPQKFRPLKDRVNIVLTSQDNLIQDDRVHVCKSFEAAYEVLKTKLCEEIETCWVVGGAPVYKQAIEHPDFNHLYMTRIKQSFDCDTFFPRIDEGWMEVDLARVPKEEQEEDGLRYTFHVYKRTSSVSGETS